jgi:hypothetical protein
VLRQDLPWRGTKHPLVAEVVFETRTCDASLNSLCASKTLGNEENHVMLFGGTFREPRVSLMNVTQVACSENHGPFGEVGRAPVSTHHCSYPSTSYKSRVRIQARVFHEN